MLKLAPVYRFVPTFLFHNMVNTLPLNMKLQGWSHEFHRWSPQIQEVTFIISLCGNAILRFVTLSVTCGLIWANFKLVLVPMPFVMLLVKTSKKVTYLKLLLLEFFLFHCQQWCLWLILKFIGLTMCAKDLSNSISLELSMGITGLHARFHY